MDTFGERIHDSEEYEMFGWLRKTLDSLSLQPPTLEDEDQPHVERPSITPSLKSEMTPLPDDEELLRGVEIMVRLVRDNQLIDDEGIIQQLIKSGLPELRAVRLLQFVPIAFTRFLYRTNLVVMFPPNYILMNARGQRVADRPLTDEPAFREAWRYCEKATATTTIKEYLTPVAARSGGYKAIQELMEKDIPTGCENHAIMMSPPIVME